MDITQLSGVSSDYLNTFAKKEALVPGDDDSFSAVLSTAMKSVDETNDLQNTAESEEVRFALKNKLSFKNYKSFIYAV